MEEIFLEEVTINDEKEIISLIKEYIEYGSQINGMPGTSLRNFNEFYHNLQEIKNIKFTSYEQPIVPSKTFLIKKKKDGCVVGTISIRFNINRTLDETFGGNIGYGIRLTERRKGYATQALKLALEILKSSGAKVAKLGCLSDNIGSKKAILKNNGVLIKHRELLKSEDYYEINL